jgi:serine/threonine-protein kinase
MPDLLTTEAVEAGFGDMYRGLARLGQQGAQATVYKAVAADGTTVALKVYNADQLEERSAREVDALQRLSGDTIVKLHAAGGITIEGESYRFIATTFIDGQPLSEVLAGGAISPSKAAVIGADIAAAIDELWSFKIVHRDVKPPNIMVRVDSHAVLIDLGIARHLDLVTLTGPGIAWGTFGYYAPETLRGQKPTCKADIFALGIVIEEMLLGRHPTRGRQEALMSGGPSISKHKPETPPALAALIDRMVDVKPFLRPQPREATELLRSIVDELSGGL